MIRMTTVNGLTVIRMTRMAEMQVWLPGITGMTRITGMIKTTKLTGMTRIASVNGLTRVTRMTRVIR